MYAACKTPTRIPLLANTRPMYLRPDSVFGVFVRRLKAALGGSSFSRLSAIYEEVVLYSASLRGDNNVLCTLLVLVCRQLSLVPWCSLFGSTG